MSANKAFHLNNIFIVPCISNKKEEFAFDVCFGCQAKVLCAIDLSTSHPWHLCVTMKILDDMAVMYGLA